MKKYTLILAVLFAVSMSFTSCKEKISDVTDDGFISFSDFSISCDDEVLTKATSPAGGNYVISIANQAGSEVFKTTYSEVKKNDNKISVPGGEYTMTVRSADSEIPVAAFEQPIYGATSKFSITPGNTTPIGGVTCTLLQCKVTVDYSEDFLEMVTGASETSVEVTSGHPLVFGINYDSALNKVTSYDKSAGYFLVNNGESTTLVATFKGVVDGKTVKMRSKPFTNIRPKQWRQVKFIKKVNEEGNATFDITINDMLDDAPLNSGVTVVEDVLADDPKAPKGDGGIKLSLDYEGGCDSEFTEISNLLLPPVEERAVCLKLKLEVPNGVKKMSIDIESTNASFMSAVATADAENINLLNPSPENEIIFQLVPFPHGAELIGQTLLSFDMSAAQGAILVYKGTHTFTMTVIDSKGCRNSIPVVMVVE